MKAVILAGGRGTRLEPYTTVLPKPLMPIGDLPVLEILIRRLKAHGICEITLSVGYLAELIQAFCRDGSRWGVTFHYSYEEEPLGTAGPLGLLPRSTEPLLVLNGDLLTDLDFTQFIEHHLSRDTAATIGVYEHRVRLELGIIESSLEGEVRNYIEKPEYTFRVSMGAYILESRALDLIPAHQRLDLPQLIQRLVSAGEPVGTFHHRGYWVDIGKIEDYRKALDDFPAMKDRFLSEGATKTRTAHSNLQVINLR